MSSTGSTESSISEGGTGAGLSADLSASEGQMRAVSLLLMHNGCEIKVATL